MLDPIVVTGVGVVSPIGNKQEDLWDSINQGRIGTSTIENFDTSKLNVKIAARVKNFESSFLSTKEHKRYSDYIKFAVDASGQAIVDAFKSKENLPVAPERIGVIIGVGQGSQDRVYKAVKSFEAKATVSPLLIPTITPNMAAGVVAQKFGLQGVCMGISTACASGAHAIAVAASLIRDNMADLFVVGGSEACLSPTAVAGFDAARALTRDFNHSPEEASRPFDHNRSGFVIGEGAGVVTIEKESRARARGAKIYGYLAASGLSADAHHITAPEPSGRGMIQSMSQALKMAKLLPQDIDYINAHGTSTLANDYTESLAISRVFPHANNRLYVSSTKGYTGHCIGGAGGIEAVISLLALKHQKAPKSVNLAKQSDDININVSHPNRLTRLENVMTNSFGFGGQNVSLIFSRAA